MTDIKTEKILFPIKLLIVEDQLGDVIATMLDKLNGYDIEVVKDGERAVIKALENDYDVIIMDLLLPEMSGFEAMRRIRAVNDKVPIIALSAVPTFEDRAIESGADVFIWKPPDFSKLNLIIHELSYDYRKVLPEKIDESEVIQLKRRRLSLLKEKLAVQGLSADPALIIEVEELERNLKDEPKV